MMRIQKAAWLGLLALLASAAWAAMPVETVRAHALLVRSLPEADAELAQSPTSIEMWFSEPLEAGFSRARLLTSTGQEVSTGATILDPSDPTHMTMPLGQLEPGIYTVAWQTLSRADGHEFYGSFPITVLNRDGTRPTGEPASTGTTGRGDLPSPGETIARWFWLLGSMLLFGIPLFLYVVVPAHWKGAGPLEGAARDLGLRIIWMAVLAIVFGLILQVMLQMVRLGGLGQLPNLLLDTRTGALVLSRLVLAFTGLLVTLTLPLPRPLSGRERPAFFVTAAIDATALLLLVTVSMRGEYVLAIPAIMIALLGVGMAAWSPEEALAADRRIWATLLILASALLLSISLGSHASAGAGSFWAVLADFIHLSAAAAWLGGLLLLPSLLWQAHHIPEIAPVHRGHLLLLVQRFSLLAGFSVFVILLTGLFNSLVELPGLSSLWETTYGRVLMVKLGLVALALGIATLNNRLVHGRMARLEDYDQLSRLNRQVAVEAGVSLVLMLSVAVLVQTSTPRSSTTNAASTRPALPFTAIANADDLYLHVQVAPNQVGDNRFWLHLYHEDGSPVGEVQLVQLRFKFRDASIGQSSVDLEPLGQDTFAVEGAYLSQPGTWDLSAYIRRRGLDDTLAQVSVEVPLPGANVTGSDAWQNPAPAFPPIVLAAFGLMALGAIPLLWRQPLKEAWPRLYPAFQKAGIFLLLIGLALCIDQLFNIGVLASSSEHIHRIPPSVASLEKGKALYEERCLPCHGQTGLGDGPAALALYPRPANLQVHMVPGVHTDEQIFEWITNGYPNSAMPAFKDVLTEAERWHVLNYIRTLTPQGYP